VHSVSVPSSCWRGGIDEGSIQDLGWVVCGYSLQYSCRLQPGLTPRWLEPVFRPPSLPLSLALSLSLSLTLSLSLPLPPPSPSPLSLSLSPAHSPLMDVHCEGHGALISLSVRLSFNLSWKVNLHAEGKQVAWQQGLHAIGPGFWLMTGLKGAACECVEGQIDFCTSSYC
jgi:hypothetical protein